MENNDSLATKLDDILTSVIYLNTNSMKPKILFYLGYKTCSKCITIDRKIIENTFMKYEYEILL